VSDELDQLRAERDRLRAELNTMRAAAAESKNQRKDNHMRPVLVTTLHRGVFFGYATNTDGATIKLQSARCCLYWPAEQKGFLGLARVGPLPGARVGPAADIELRDVTCVAECTPEAVARWESEPWAE
jgi:hypothetical protein